MSYRRGCLEGGREIVLEEVVGEDVEKKFFFLVMRR